MATRATDPVVSYQFAIEVAGIVPIKGYFSEISGLDVEYDVIEYTRFNMLGFPITQKIPGLPKFSPIQIKRGITSNMGFWMWHEGTSLGLVELLRANATITMFARNYQPLVQWDIVRAWPSKVSGPQISADSGDIAFETITLEHEGLRRSFMTPADIALSWLRSSAFG
jgi:phage tail-like protein